MRAVNTALLPVEGFVWGVAQIKEFVTEKVAKKLAKVPPEDIQAPKAHIGVPAIDALRYTGAEPDLADLYANLLATAMDRKTAFSAHPGFVDMIKNMSPDEARIMRFLASNNNYLLIDIHHITTADSSYVLLHRHVSLLGIDAKCHHPALAASYLDNLERLGLVHCSESSHLKDQAVYQRIEDFPQIKSIVEDLKQIPD